MNGSSSDLFTGSKTYRVIDFLPEEDLQGNYKRDESECMMREGSDNCISICRPEKHHLLYFLDQIYFPCIFLYQA